MNEASTAFALVSPMFSICLDFLRMQTPVHCRITQLPHLEPLVSKHRTFYPLLAR
jgi:hypothetical protein